MADGTIDSARKAERKPPPPPPPPPPRAEPTRDAQQREQAVANAAETVERRGNAGQALMNTRARTNEAPALPGEEPTRTQPTKPVESRTSEPAAEPAKPEASRASRFFGGLWSGVKSGVKGVYEGAKALVTDPVGTAKAVGTAIGNAASATADYGKRLVTNPGETLKQTGEFLKQKANDIANATAEDWGKFIGEAGVGLVGGYGAGKALQGIKAARAAQLANRTPDVPDAKKLEAPTSTSERAPTAATPDRAPERTPDRAPDSTPEPASLRNPHNTTPIQQQRLSDVGRQGQGGLTATEQAAVNRYQDALNRHNGRFGLNKDLPPTADKLSQATRHAERNNNKLAQLHVDLRRTDEAINKHIRPDELAGRIKEQRGVSTGYDHVQEVQNNYDKLRNQVKSLDKFLKQNWDLPQSQQRYLRERLQGYGELKRILEQDFGLRRQGPR